MTPLEKAILDGDLEITEAGRDTEMAWTRLTIEEALMVGFVCQTADGKKREEERMLALAGKMGKHE